MAANPAGWRHGYDISLETELKAGSLYPILIRLADRGLLEAQWESDPPPGRPARHLYRLTTAGLQLALAYAESGHAKSVAARAGHAARAGVPRLGLERG